MNKLNDGELHVLVQAKIVLAQKIKRLAYIQVKGLNPNFDEVGRIL